jgi:RNA polymerase sigma factor (sigma-70 family)
LRKLFYGQGLRTVDTNTNPNISDRELLRECVYGKEWAWKIFYERFARLISATISRTASLQSVNLNHEDMEDCKQLVWASFLENEYKKLKSYKGINGCSVATWLKTCTVNATINFLTSVSRHKHLPLEGILTTENRSLENPEKTATQQELWERIIQIVEKELSTRERLFAHLYWFDEVSFGEISLIMHLSTDNIYLLKHRIQKKIQQFLKEPPPVF